MRTLLKVLQKSEQMLILILHIEKDASNIDGELEDLSDELKQVRLEQQKVQREVQKVQQEVQNVVEVLQDLLDEAVRRRHPGQMSLAQTLEAPQDLLQEARHLDSFRKNFENDERIVFPRPLHHLCSREVLVETWVEGKHMEVQNQFLNLF